MPFKSIILPLSASLVLHTLLAVSFYQPGAQKEDAGKKFVDISYVRYVPEKNAPPQIQYPPVIKNAQPSKEKAVLIKAPARSLNNNAAAPIERVIPAAAAKEGGFIIKSSDELLADPQKGKIFLNYFGLVRQRVRHEAEKGFLRGSLGHGDVMLYFVLKSDGAVVNVSVINERSSAEPFIKDFAVRCVRACSPFPRFPKELGMQRISFNLSILFDETS